MSVALTKSILDKVTGCALLYRGGEADVYSVLVEDNEFVLKWYHEGCRFEPLVASKLERLNVAGLYRVRESGVRENTPYLLYDYVHGVSSAEVSKMPVAVALNLLRGVAKTLDVLALEEVHHGDLNPSNVILCRADAPASIESVLIDFGIVGPGVLPYAAPERLQGKPASTKSDLYSLGLILFRWIAGCDLIEVDGFDDFAQKSAAIDNVDVTERLYEIGCCGSVELSALEPLWKSLLRSNPDDRAEDFDELDELLEIALASIGVGEVTLCTALKSFANSALTDKMERKVSASASEGEKTPLPYQKVGAQPKKIRLKILGLGILGLILGLIALLVVVGTKSPDIDATGDLLLKKSRNLESVDVVPDSVAPSSDSTPSILLDDLPTPALDDLP